MASSDVAIALSAIQAAPKDYTLSGTQELSPLSVRASIDGSGAATAYLPALQLIAPSGQVLWTAVTSDTVAAGASADVSWFPRVGGSAAAAPPTPASAGGINAIAEELGLLAWTVDPDQATSTVRPFDKLYLNAVWLAAGTVITSVAVYVGALEAVHPTHAYMGVYSSTFALVASTPDTPSIGANVGWQTVALSSPYTTPSDGLYWLAVLYDPASRTPTMVSAQLNAFGAVLPSGATRSPAVVTPTTLPNPFVSTSQGTICLLMSVL